jgi:hypothetical protein
MIIRILLLLVILAFTLLGCGKQTNLSIEARIIYNLGGPQPVARTKFYLLDADPFSVKPAESPRNDLALTGCGILLLLKTAVDKPQMLEGKNAKTFLGSVEASRPCWEGHLVKETITDFEGRAQLDQIRPGKYWLLGMTETRSAFALWNVPLVLPLTETKLLLDQNNAIYSK